MFEQFFIQADIVSSSLKKELNIKKKYFFRTQSNILLRVLRLVDEDGVSIFTRIISVGMVCHKVTGSSDWALFSKSGNFSRIVNFVIFQDSEFFLLSLVLVFLWCGVSLLLSLLSTTAETEDEMKGRLLLDIIIRQSSTIF